MTDLAVVAGVLAVVALMRHLIEGFPVTPPMIFVAAGVVLCRDLAGVTEIELESEGIALLAELTLALLLFSDAARIDVRRLRRSVGVRRVCPSDGRQPTSSAIRRMPSSRSASPSAKLNRAYPGAPKASPGTNATLAWPRTRSASSNVLVAVCPLISRPSRPDTFGKQ